jgi:hypothetical protein
MKSLSRLLFAAIFVAALSLAASAQTRVTFAKGATGKTISGQLSGFNSERVYLIRVNRGQTLKVEQLARDRRRTTITIEDPAGEDASDMDASCNNQKRVSPTLKGDYRVTVVECRKADRWRGSYRIRFSVR